MEYVLSTLVTAVVFFVFLLLLAAKPKVSKIITIVATTCGGVLGLLIYGYGYVFVTEHVVLAILKAVYSVCRAFVGVNDYGAIADAPFMQTQWMQILCMLVQICLLYATASAVIATIGGSALKMLRLWFGRRKDLNLIYGTNGDALNFGRCLVAKKSGTVIFVDPQADSAADATVSAMGCVLQRDGSAGKTFLRRVGFTVRRNVTLYALDRDSNKNIRYATQLMNTLETLGASPEKTNLVLMGQEETAVSRLQNTEEKYGYGFVTAVNEPQMVARLLTVHYPPCNAISFDTDGRAVDDFEALLVGFGQVGQAVLKSLVMNGQFEGSHFKLDVFANDAGQKDGNFTFQLGAMLEAYDVCFHTCDAKSRDMYAHLKARAKTLRYVVISAGTPENNREIAEEILSYLGSIGCRVPVYGCSRQGVVAYAPDGAVTATHGIYSADVLCGRELDQKAMIFNHRYHASSDKTALQNWMACDYFSRQSCRAATDFISAMLRAADKTAVDGDWELSDSQIENLSKTEHRRWCAFHYCMGFTAMDSAEWSERAQQYAQQKEQGITPTVRIGKNMVRKTHACLVSWDELDALSEKEAAVTGKAVDYKAMDTNNVMAIPLLLQTAKT